MSVNKVQHGFFANHLVIAQGKMPWKDSQFGKIEKLNANLVKEREKQRKSAASYYCYIGQGQ